MEQARQTLEAQVLERAAKDPEFRQRLKEQPKQTVEQEFGIQVPPDIEVAVVEETPQQVYLVLPPAPVQRGQELTGQELEAVAGGWAGLTEYETGGCLTCGETCGTCGVQCDWGPT